MDERPDEDDDGVAAPYGQPPTAEDERGEGQPAGGQAVDEAAEEADAVEDPSPAG